MKQYVPRTGAALLAAGCVATIHAQDPETDALRLADQVPTVEARPGDWRTFVETAVGASEARADGRTRPSRRFSFDLQFDHAWSPQWRAVLSDRLDASWPAQGSGDHGVNTLKEAYAGWRDASSYTMLDLGRINVRNGVAMGYNPTDFLRAGAVRSLV